jgi:hypothetical protein
MICQLQPTRLIYSLSCAHDADDDVHDDHDECTAASLPAHGGPPSFTTPWMLSSLASVEAAIQTVLRSRFEFDIGQCEVHDRS